MLNAIDIKIGGQIEQLRIDKGLTQEELALRIGVSRVSLVHIEQGKQVTKIYRLFDIAIALDVDIDDILPTKQWYEQNKGKKLRKVISYEIVEAKI